MFENLLNIHSFKCPKCNNNVLVEDVDYNFKGNEDDYCICDVCKVNFFIKVRYGKICKVEISKEDTELIYDNVLSDFVEKK